MDANLISWIIRAVTFGVIILFGSMGEIITEKSGNLNLGVPGIMYLGAFAGFATGYYYEKLSSNPNAVVCVILCLIAAFVAAMIGGLIYSFITVTLRANQNVTGLALTIFGKGVANFFGAIILGGQSYTKAELAYNSFSAKIPGLSNWGIVGKLVFSYGFLAYVAVVLAIILGQYLKKSRTGLNLRAVGENPATADAAGVNVTKYKYLATCLGAGISGLGGLYYVIDYNSGIWATTGDIEALGWLAVALVIFATWKPISAVFGSLLFGFLYWLYQFLPNMLGISIPNYAIDLIQMVPYIVTIAVLIVTGMRKSREGQGPASLGLSYFREER